LGLDQNVGTIVWSPLSAGLLSGKFKRNQPKPENSRLSQGGSQGPETNFELLYNIIDVLEEVAEETGKSIAQVSLNWLLQRPGVVNIVIGARNEEQLRQNLGATGWKLTAEQIRKLDAASEVPPIYPYWHQRGNQTLNPIPMFY